MGAAIGAGDPACVSPAKELRRLAARGDQSDQGRAAIRRQPVFSRASTGPPDQSARESPPTRARSTLGVSATVASCPPPRRVLRPASSNVRSAAASHLTRDRQPTLRMPSGRQCTRASPDASDKVAPGTATIQPARYESCELCNTTMLTADGEDVPHSVASANGRLLDGRPIPAGELRITGEVTRQQYCKITGDQSLLQMTLARIGPSVPAARRSRTARSRSYPRARGISERVHGRGSLVSDLG